MKQPDQAEREKWLRELESLPRVVREICEAYPPWTCYRMVDSPGHYAIVAYDPTPSLAEPYVMLRLAHGSDSTAPGVAVFGIRPDSVTECGCGKWEEPTPAQARETAERMRAIIESANATKH